MLGHMFHFEPNFLSKCKTPWSLDVSMKRWPLGQQIWELNHIIDISGWRKQIRHLMRFIIVVVVVGGGGGGGVFQSQPLQIFFGFRIYKKTIKKHINNHRSGSSFWQLFVMPGIARTALELVQGPKGRIEGKKTEWLMIHGILANFCWYTCVLVAWCSMYFVETTAYKLPTDVSSIPGMHPAQRGKEHTPGGAGSEVHGTNVLVVFTSLAVPHLNA